VLAPERRPSVAAPLGWVLSEATTKDLDNQLSLRRNDPEVCALRRQVTGREDPCSTNRQPHRL
jgi:hypothetical protein